MIATYFVAYKFEALVAPTSQATYIGTGNSVITSWQGPIKDSKQLRDIEQRIAKSEGHDTVIITNIVLLDEESDD